MEGTIVMTARVLLCDDTPDMRVLLKTLLEFEPGIEVVGEAGNGIEAVVLADLLRPEVILLDVAMPYMDGLQVLAALRNLSATARIAVLSGFDVSEAGERAIELGADRYVEKGAAPDEIVAAVQELQAMGPRNAAATTNALDDAFGRVRLGLAGVESAVALVESDGHYVATNQAFEDLVGYSAEALRHMTYIDLTHPDEVEVCRRAAEDLFSGQRDRFDMQKTYVRHDGSYLYTKLSLAAVPTGVAGERLGLGIVSATE